MMLRCGMTFYYTHYCSVLPTVEVLQVQQDWKVHWKIPLVLIDKSVRERKVEQILGTAFDLESHGAECWIMTMKLAHCPATSSSFQMALPPSVKRKHAIVIIGFTFLVAVFLMVMIGLLSINWFVSLDGFIISSERPTTISKEEGATNSTSDDRASALTFSLLACEDSLGFFLHIPDSLYGLNVVVLHVLEPCTLLQRTNWMLATILTCSIRITMSLRSVAWMKTWLATWVMDTNGSVIQTGLSRYPVNINVPTKMDVWYIQLDQMGCSILKRPSRSTCHHVRYTPLILPISQTRSQLA